MRHRLLAIAIVFPVAVGCSTSEPADDAALTEPSAGLTAQPADADGATTQTTVDGPIATPPSTIQPASDPTTVASTLPTPPPATATPTTLAANVTYPSAAPELGLAPMVQSTPVDGGGSRPLLEWEPVDGAALYHVFVLAPSGVVYWGWPTESTSVPVGGLPQLDEVAPGPAISEGMTWSVSAADADGHIIALSPQRPIAP